MTDRMDRVVRMMKREISVILLEEINDPRIQHVTITRIEVTRDLRLAKVFCTISTDEKGKRDVMKGLNSASSFVRGELAKRMSMKFTPSISFWEDREPEREEAIDSIFEQIEKEHLKTENSEEG